MRLTEPLVLGGRSMPSRVVFGPHETNLARPAAGRAVSDRHVAYYRRRAEGGAGLVVVEVASVHPSDWPYERAPLAAECGPGWARVAAAVHAAGGLAVAGLGHAGGQGYSAYSQAALWAPSGVPDPASREVPKAMEPEDVAAVVAGFAQAAQAAAAAGLDGVEVNAGQHALIRQFLSGLTNQRGDAYGTDRLRLAREALRAVRAAAPGALVGLRLACDELFPWGGILPEEGVQIAAALAEDVDYLVVVRGSHFGTWATRPDGHTPPGFNLELTSRVRAAVDPRVAVVAQGSVVDVEMAEEALASGVCDAVEMTRAQIADPELVAKVRAGTPGRIRPCILCNQSCQVRDVRNPLVSCVGEPSAGHETEDPPVEGTAERPREVLVVGGGPAGLEAARVAAQRGHRMRLVERDRRLGGMLRAAAAGPGRQRLALLADWLEAECRRLGVGLETGREVTADDLAAPAGGSPEAASDGTPSGQAGAAADITDGPEGGPADTTGHPTGTAADTPRGPAAAATDTTSRPAGAAAHAPGGPAGSAGGITSGPAGAAAPGAGWAPAADRPQVLLCTGGRAGALPFPAGRGAVVRTAAEVLAAAGGDRLERCLPDGPVLVWDPVGGPVAVAIAELLAPTRAVTLLTGDLLVGRELARSGDLAPANVRLHQAGVRLVKRAKVVGVEAGKVEAEDLYSGERTVIDAAALVDAGHRLPDDRLWRQTGGTLPRAGDAVAPRGIHEAVLEGRRAALRLESPAQVPSPAAARAPHQGRGQERQAGVAPSAAAQERGAGGLGMTPGGGSP